MIRSIGPAELIALLTERASTGGAIIIDVREANEWARGRIAGAHHVPLGQLRTDPTAALPKEVDRPTIFVCAQGVRSVQAAQAAVQAGFRDVYSLVGGLSAWLAAGLPVETDDAVRPATAQDFAAVPAAEPTLDTVVGANLKAHRTRIGLTLDELSTRAGVSRSLLGQIELGRSMPSIGVVWRIAQTLGVHFSTLLNTASGPGMRILKRATARRLQSADGRFSSRALFPLEDPQKAEFYELWLAPHAREDADAHRPGTRENLIVTSGRLELHIGPQRVVLEPGDALTFTADVPHSYINLSGAECWLYLVMTYAEPD